MLNPNWPKGNPMNELCWSENEYCKASENWCFLSKTEAESEAWEYAKKKGLHLVTVCPALIIGPMLQSTVNASSSILLKILKDGAETMVNKDQRIVDVRDVTRAVLLAYEKCEAEGRYICSAYMVKTQDLIEKLKTMYPKYNYPQKITEADDQPKLNCEKMQKLGWTHRTLEECLTDSVICYQEKGILD
ncbi:cinnamoyl-CoA reductase 2-like [Papaver somniferum]|uniref:cinnamoyl-CoA reductase 2-like n=1 Tax=Papaver somniferum TaxID=3469 RepID=UPI000E6FF0AF|nr:cinnamoyl-CoA reductase 2-like [Papaver somniferum]